MKLKYYLDTCIWVDLYEERTGYFDEPFHDIAWKLLSLIKEKNHKIIVTDVLFIELTVHHSIEQINGMFLPFQNFIEKIISTKKQEKEAKKISQERYLPKGDVLHAIISRDHELIFVTRDKHFLKLRDIIKSLKPEDLI
ncbi:type II toxin-antitoxin system VapC family toxin [Candidatus Woesearchaeota archaeon]|nr:type II toxin-antitoxin system VapC family toxin [Candidatus Woesearchaeota archaeon]